MKLVVRVALAFALVAVFAAGLTGWLSYYEAKGHFSRFVAGGETGRGGLAQGRGREVLLAELRSSSLRSTLFVLVVALGAGGFLAYRLVQPVQHITAAMRRYGLGERTARISVRGNDELSEMGQVFNDVAGELAAKEERERQMVADIAHELRTPLTILKGDLESMSDGLLDASRENLQRLVGEVDVLSRLVQDLRTLSLCDAGQLTLHKRTVRLDELVQKVVEGFRTRADASGIVLSAKLESITAEADPERIKQVLFNLLDNALRHTPQTGRIEMALRLSQTKAMVEVNDTGPGIAPQHLPHLFERFYRAEAARGREGGGSGLGLAIVKALIEAHGGNVGAENRAQGGARFWIGLPIGKPNEPALPL